MKKVLRVFIPILLVAAIIGGAIWYLFVYDREFTRDMFLQAARYFEDQDDLVTATWFYDRAYDMGTGNDAVAIELARQYVADGNYTQAEKVLSKAMRDGGGIDIYTTLCSLYVQQDKLIDAVALLDGITDPALKAALSNVRPAPPTGPEYDDFLNQHSSVELSSATGKVYVNPNGEYPSIKTDLYTGPVNLVSGVNTLYAVTVSDDGIVSPLSIFHYTVVGVIEEVKFQDPVIEQLIRGILHCSDDQVLYSNDLWTITSLTVPAGASNYSDLRYCVFLESLTIEEGVENQLSFLQDLKMLKSLHISGTPVNIAELQYIGQITTLEELTLHDCSLSVISYLAELKNLKYLDLSRNYIQDISIISGFSKVQELYLQENALTKIDALSECTNLKRLNISNNSVRSISPVAALPRLETLYASTNNITTLDTSDRFPSLTDLNLKNNMLTDVSALGNFKNLIYLNLSGNGLTDISSLSELIKLAELDFSYNTVTSLPEFKPECELVTIDGTNNRISDLTNLSVLDMLNTVIMTGNTEISDITVLLECDMLFYVRVDGTNITTDEQVIPLEERNVKVFYDEKL